VRKCWPNESAGKPLAKSRFSGKAPNRAARAEAPKRWHQTPPENQN
jgi:hypothetical protein